MNPRDLTPAGGAAIALRGLSKRYGGTLSGGTFAGGTLALDSVSFDVAPGEFVALLGPSGAGKSTVFRCLTALARPDSGEVRVNGRAIDRLAGRELRETRRAIGLIFQQFNLVNRLSAIDNVLAGRLGHVSTLRVFLRRFPPADRQIALACLDRVGLLERAYQRADSLSGGQQQRVAIARVLAQECRVILADEPVSSLDPESAANVLSTLRAIARASGIAVLCSLHQVDLARRYADRVVALRDGRCVMDAPAAALDGEAMLRIYGGAAAVPDESAVTGQATALPLAAAA